MGLGEGYVESYILSPFVFFQILHNKNLRIKQKVWHDKNDELTKILLLLKDLLDVPSSAPRVDLADLDASVS